ncbi:MAG: 3'(2'),5'-bisphosphate nucleotidase CysQ [Acidimicrobiales bacterium]
MNPQNSGRSDHRDAASIATAAGEILMELRRSGAAGLGSLGPLGDQRAHHHIVGLLAEHHPSDAVLSEEGPDDPARLHAERVWIVDPLDGTREYAEPERTDWAVHVALWSHGELVAGAVALPALGVTVASDDAARAAGAPPPGPLRILVSRSRPPPVAAVVARALGAELFPMGSAGAKAMAVVRGEAQAYVHSGGQYEWDSAAPVVVARCHGLHASRLDGSPLHYNQPDPWLPDQLICRPELAQRVLDATGP